MPPGVKWDQKFQSTHPVRGATRRNSMYLCEPRNFNPRTPCGVRLTLTGHVSINDQFQSTHPVRGATKGYLAKELRRRGISIHAPRAGCDAGVINNIAVTVEFQSTHPVRGATKGADGAPGKDGAFQSTHPVRGATANMYNLVCSYFCNFTKSDVCLLTLYLFYHAISTENVVFSRFSAVRSAPGIHVRSRFAPRQSISSPSGA